MGEKAKQKIPESGVLKACLDLLAAERIWAMRMNTGVMRQGKRVVHFAVEGCADILAGPPCCQMHRRFLWIECKSDSGKQSETQKSFQGWVGMAGHTYLLVRDVDELRRWLVEHGAIKGEE